MKKAISNRLFHVTALLLILALLASGCGGTGASGGSSDAGSTATGVKSASEQEESTETADAPADTNTKSAGSAGEAANTETAAAEEDLSAANAAAAAQAGALNADSDWVTFLLLCNEGMNNTGSNVGNTLMGVSVNPNSGKIRLMMVTWDTFIEYEGYDIPQLLDMAYRNNGPEEAVKVFDANFDMHIDRFMSLNFLNLARLIDTYGGVDVDITRAERNALNGLVASKRRNLQSEASSNMLTQHVLEMIEQDYHLTEFGPDTHLNGLQAVAFGWLQYDSVYNCCNREVEVIADLFDRVGIEINKEVAFYTDASGPPEASETRRPINLDDVTEEDRRFLMESLSPIIDTSYNNLSEEDFSNLALAFARTAYMGSREGVDILDNLERAIFPIEAKDPYETIAGTEGHLIDYEANSKAMKGFLYKTED